MTVDRNLLAGAIGSLVAGPSPHVQRYVARVDERLDALPNDECRRGFLGDELAKWEARYSDYCAKVDTHQPTDDRVTAWDYVETMSELDKRIAKVSAKETT